MVIYEVNLELEPGIKEEYKQWLPNHIKEVLKCRGFIGAKWYELERTAEDKIVWSIQYSVKDRLALEEYLSHDAPRLREEAKQVFGDKFQTRKRILSLIEAV